MHTQKSTGPADIDETRSRHPRLPVLRNMNRDSIFHRRKSRRTPSFSGDNHQLALLLCSRVVQLSTYHSTTSANSSQARMHAQLTRAF
jgi:hypothetical protein